MSPPQWAECPVCGIGHTTIAPGSPCSSVCAARARSAGGSSSSGKGKDYQTSEPGKTPKNLWGDNVPQGGLGAPEKGGWCSIVLGGATVGLGAVAYGLLKVLR